jgi:hypothetical protein
MAIRTSRQIHLRKLRPVRFFGWAARPDGMRKQRVPREFLRNLGRHPRRASVRVLFDRWRAIEGRPRPAEISARPASPSSSLTNQENDDVHA